MENGLHILILEDLAADAELLKFELEDAGIEFNSKWVMTEKDYVQALQAFSPDLILSDYDLPQYNGALALAEAKRRCPDTPFILVTGAVGEDRAIEILTQGAKDYVLKNRFSRLVPAVRRALMEAEEHRARKKAEKDLQESYKNLERQVEDRTSALQAEVERRKEIEKDLFHYNQRLELLSDTAGRLLASDNPRQLVEELCLKVMDFLDCQAFFNFLVDEAVGRLHLNAYAGIPPEKAREIEWLDYGIAVCGCAARDRCRIVAEYIPETPDIRTEMVKSFGIKAYACHPLMDQDRAIGTLSFGTRSRMTFSADDLSLMKAVANHVAIAMNRIRIEDALRASEARYRSLTESSPSAIFISRANRIAMLNPAAIRLLGLDNADRLLGRPPIEVFHADCRAAVARRIEKLMEGQDVPPGVEKIVHRDGEVRYVEVTTSSIIDAGEPVIQIILRDITERRQAEKERKVTISFLDMVNRSMSSHDLLQAAAVFFQDKSDCEAVGIRLKDGNDYPYYIAQGFPPSFIEAESSLFEKDAAGNVLLDNSGNPCLGCMCGNIVCGRTDLSRTYFTPHGSFWTNGLTELVAAADTAARSTLSRLGCNAEGYESIALIPLQVGTELLGLVQLNDRRKGMFSPAFISQWERLADQFAVALAKFRSEEALYESEERYRSLVESSPDGVIVHREGRFLYANSSALRLYGAETLVQLRGKTILDLIHPDERDAVASWMRQEERLISRETRMMRLDGQVFPVEAVGAAINFQGKTAIQIIFRDITKRSKRTRELDRLNQMLKALGKSSQALMHATDETAFMEEVCRIVLEDCGHAMLWIGFVEEDEDKTVRPIAAAGFEDGYLDTLKITWADTERGRGPTGTAIRTQKPSICRDMLTDPNFSPWCKDAIKRGYASSIALPLISGGKVFGIFSIYSKERDPFTEDEVKLLSELADDLSYGVMSIRLRSAHAKTKEALSESEERLRTLFNSKTY